MKTYNPAFLLQKKDRQGNDLWEGYGIASIVDFAENVAFLKAGGSLASLEGSYPSGTDGLEVTRIAVAVHESIERAQPVDIQRD